MLSVYVREEEEAVVHEREGGEGEEWVGWLSVLSHHKIKQQT